MKTENTLVPVLALLQVALKSTAEGFLKRILSACNQKCPGIAGDLVEHRFRRCSKPCAAADPVVACRIVRCLPYDDPEATLRSCVNLARHMTGNEEDTQDAVARSDFAEPSPPPPQTRRAFFEGDTAALQNAVTRFQALQAVGAPEALLEEVKLEIFEASRPREWDAMRLLEEHFFHPREEAYVLAPQFGNYLRDACDPIMPRPSTREQVHGGDLRDVRHWDRSEYANVIHVAYCNLTKTEHFARVAPGRAASLRLSEDCTRLCDRAHAHSRARVDALPQGP
jgi:hypothetical protein